MAWTQGLARPAGGPPRLRAAHSVGSDFKALPAQPIPLSTPVQPASCSGTPITVCRPSAPVPGTMEETQRVRAGARRSPEVPPKHWPGRESWTDPTHPPRLRATPSSPGPAPLTSAPLSATQGARVISVSGFAWRFRFCVASPVLRNVSGFAWRLRFCVAPPCSSSCPTVCQPSLPADPVVLAAGPGSRDREGSGKVLRRRGDCMVEDGPRPATPWGAGVRAPSRGGAPFLDTSKTSRGQGREA